MSLLGQSTPSLSTARQEAAVHFQASRGRMPTLIADFDPEIGRPNRDCEQEGDSGD